MLSSLKSYMFWSAISFCRPPQLLYQQRRANKCDAKHIPADFGSPRDWDKTIKMDRAKGSETFDHKMRCQCNAAARWSGGQICRSELSRLIVVGAQDPFVASFRKHADIVLDQVNRQSPNSAARPPLSKSRSRDPALSHPQPGH
jgi:hypothetical protein